MLFALALGYNIFDVGFLRYGLCKMCVSVFGLVKNHLLQSVVTVETVFQAVDFVFGNAAVEVRLHILRRGRFRIVNIPAYIAVVIFGGENLSAHHTAVSVDFYLVVIYVTDFFDIFGTERILIFSLFVFPVGIYKKHTRALRCLCLVDDKQRSRYARAVKQSLRQSDNTFENAIRVGSIAVDKPLTHFLLFASTKQHAVRHHHSHTPIVFQNRNHVLNKHKVGLLFLAHPILETLFILHIGGGVVLRKRRIRHHNVVLYE